MNFYEKLARYEHLIIFGYSELGKFLYQNLMKKLPQINIEVCDNHPQKQGELILGGKHINSVEEAVSNYAGGVFIPTSLHHSDAMCNQLNALGVPNENIFQDRSMIAAETERLKNLRCTPRTRLSFEVDVVRHCNLNCKGCLRFSPLVKRADFLDVFSYKKDIQRLSSVFGGDADHIYLLGGEPLLNPNIVEYLRITRDGFPECTLSILTNGTLIERMGENFWNACRINNVVIRLTQYPLGINYNAIFKKIQNSGIEVESTFSLVETCEMFYCWPFDFSGQQNIEENFADCLAANSCTVLRNGKLYPCGIIANIDLFNDFFSSEMMPCEEDSIDIYSEKTKDDILKFLSKAVPFCRYCDVKGRHDVKWEISRKDIHEWS